MHVWGAREAWRHYAEAIRRASRTRRAVITALHVLVGTALVIAVGVLFLWLLQQQVVGSQTSEDRIQLAELGVVVVLFLVFLLLWAWLHPILKVAGRRRRDAFWLSCVLVLTLTAFLSSREPPDASVSAVIETVLADLEATIDAPQSGHDVVFVVDSSDPGVRRLVRAARSRPTAVASSLTAAVEEDVRFGLIEVHPARPKPDWSVVQEVTADRYAIVNALAAMSIESSKAPAVRSYARAIYEAATPQKSLVSSHLAYPDVGWRPRAEQSIVLLADRLPARSELDWAYRRALEGSGRSSYLSKAGWQLVVPGAVPWSHVLRNLSADARVFRRPSLSVVTKSTSPLLAAWRRWTARTGGEVIRPGHIDGAQSALDAAGLAAIGTTTRRLQRLASDYRPFLFFDSQEKFGVLNVEQFLSETDSDGNARHEVCDRRVSIRDDSCDPVLSVHDLRPGYDYVDLGDELSDKGPRDESGVIYYQVVSDKSRLHLSYWWFFRYNESPVWSRFNCVAGLAIAEKTCFDHEGDWEGVTVTLDKKTERPLSVTYYGHGWPGYRFRWPDLKQFGSVTGKHAHAYVAFGSHASYPVKCLATGLKCKQFIFRKYGQTLPDGRHDGGEGWYGNEKCDACVQPLPVNRHGEPTEWNGFSGRWGKSECTRVAHMCLKSDGPRSPSKQPRTVIPPPGVDFEKPREILGVLAVAG